MNRAYQPTRKSRLCGLSLLFLVLLQLAGCQPLTDNQQSAVSSGQAQQASTELAALFARNYRQDLQRSPMTQTTRGLKTDYHRWDNISESFDAESNAINSARLQELANFDHASLSSEQRLSADVYRVVLEREQALYPYRHHSYIMQQFSGWHTQIPSFLINQHRIDNTADAEAYIQRIYAVRPLVESIVEQLTIRENSGLLPPRWTYPKMIQAANNILTGQPFDNSSNDSALLNDFRTKVTTLKLAPAKQQQLIADAGAALLNALEPAYRQLTDKLQTQQGQAPTQDGLWKLPGGDDYYAVLLNFFTSTDLNAEQIHQLGLEQVRRIHGEMRALMQSLAFKGDLQDFFAVMRTDPRFYYADSDSGRERYLADTRKILGSMDSKLPQMFITQPKAPLTIKRVEAFREQSAGKAFYSSPAADGSRPGIYYVNLYDMGAMPSYQLEALAFHEAAPGHHMQRALTVEMSGLPEFQKYARFTAFTEGWGLYAEYLAWEMGFYQDPYSNFGRLALELRRACRLVVDTGLHAKGWSKQQAIDYLLLNTPNSAAGATKDIERYSVYPGQATAYMIGKMKILQLREGARKSLGNNFDIREFHDQVLKNGPLPLSLLEQNIQAWIQTKLTAPR